MGALCLLIIVSKSLCALVRSDGEPTGEREDKIRSVIKDAKKACKKSHVGEGAVAFEFAQVRSAVLSPGTPAATHRLAAHKHCCHCCKGACRRLADLCGVGRSR